MRITVDEVPKEISTGRNCDPSKWNVIAGRCNGTKEDIKSLNAFLDTLQTKVHEARRKLLEKDETITSDSIKAILKGTNKNARMLLQIFQQHNDEVKELIGRDLLPQSSNDIKLPFNTQKLSCCGSMMSMTSTGLTGIFSPDLK